MESRDEWCFEFHVHAAEPIAGRLMDDLLCVEAVGWAEARHLGVGGGCRPASPEADGAARCWHFHFGLCAGEGGQVIPAVQAAELEELLRAWCRERGLGFAGGFRPFTAAEMGG